MSLDLEAVVGDTQDGKKQELRLWLRLLSVSKLISQEIRRRLRLEFGATLPQFDLLAQLNRESDGLNLGELSKRTKVTNGKITGPVERLEDDGFLTREQSNEDRRVTVARIAPKGRNTFARMAQAHESWLQELMEGVDAATPPPR